MIVRIYLTGDIICAGCGEHQGGTPRTHISEIRRDTGPCECGSWYQRVIPRHYFVY